MFNHVSVMPDETLAALRVKPDGVYIDGTLGGAGHAEQIIKLLDTGLLVGIDRDGAAIAAARERLLPYEGRFLLARDNFFDINEVAARLHIRAVDGILLDLGVSSPQLDTPDRGFSYMHDARLDMRMDDRASMTAYTLVNSGDADMLTRILFEYGEERYAKRIVRAIEAERAKKSISTTLQLVEIIKKAVPSRGFGAGGGHPAKRTFQALRIAVNNELSPLDGALRDMVKLLKPGGRLCVITFHSLEDRIVKQCFKSLADPCDCPRELPVCVCGKQPTLRVITRKPIVPSEAECTANHRAHSAKLRVGEAIGDGG